MIKMLLFQSLGGLGLFLFGMKIMSEGLQKVAGKKIRQILGMVSNNRFVGCAVGALVTSVIQSSSATTVMLVGFVDAGLMSLRQAVGVVLGANIGTTVTAQLIAFKIQDYALPAIALGVLIKFFMGGRRRIYVGDVLLGFGLIFYGLAIMKAGFAPLKDDPTFISFFTRFNTSSAGGLMACVMVGMILTMILQSSSATVGITMALASQGLLNFEASVGLILGDNIGTTITAQLASIGAGLNARRTARAHALFNVIGVLLVILIFPGFIKAVIWVTSTFLSIGAPDAMVGGEYPNIARYIANSHSIFNVISALFFLIFLPYLVKTAIWICPMKKEEKAFDMLHQIKYLDSKYIDVPSVALSQVRAEVLRMGEAAKAMFEDIISSIKARELKKLRNWKKKEDELDHLQREINQYLTKVMQRPISSEESKEVGSLMRMANNLERIGDSLENLAELGEELIIQDLRLSEGGWQDFKTISQEAKKFLGLVVECIAREDDDIMRYAQDLEDNINNMREEMRGNYIMRLQNGLCTVDPGLILVDMLTAFEKIGDYCYNISQAVAKIR